MKFIMLLIGERVEEHWTNLSFQILQTLSKCLGPFTFNGGQGYDQTGAKGVGIVVQHLGWKNGHAQSNKHYLQKESLIQNPADFREKGLRISQAERQQHDH